PEPDLGEPMTHEMIYAGPHQRAAGAGRPVPRCDVDREYFADSVIAHAVGVPEAANGVESDDLVRRLGDEDRAWPQTAIDAAAPHVRARRYIDAREELRWHH